MDLTSLFPTKAMYCIDCKKRVAVDLSKQSQCPDCHSFQVSDMSQTARFQTPAQVAGRGKRTVVRPGHKRNREKRAAAVNSRGKVLCVLDLRELGLCLSVRSPGQLLGLSSDEPFL